MGNFNHKGNLSNLPIKYNDDIIIIIGLRRKELDHFSLGYSFTPITLPIFGKYNGNGGIKNIKKTPCTDYTEDFFDMLPERLIEIAWYLENNNKRSVIEEYTSIMDKIKPLLSEYDRNAYTLGYFIEHLDIFNKMYKIADVSRGEYKSYTLPLWEDKILEELGYLKTIIGHGKNNIIGDNAIWSHNKLPEIIRSDGSFYLQSDINNNNIQPFYPKCIADLYRFVGSEIPEKYNQSWLEYKFNECMHMPISKRGKIIDCYFINSYKVSGFFQNQSYHNSEYFALIFDTKKGGHLRVEFKTEFIKFAAFINCMETMDFTWGVSNQCIQDINYKYYNEFIDTCKAIINKESN